MTSLNELRLNNVSRKNSLDFSFTRSLPELKEIELKNNELKTINSSIYNNLKRLTRLNLKGNVIEKLEGRAFEGLLHMKKLDISNNRISYVDNDLVKNLDNLALSEFNFNDNECMFLVETNKFNGYKAQMQYNQIKGFSCDVCINF